MNPVKFNPTSARLVLAALLLSCACASAQDAHPPAQTPSVHTGFWHKLFGARPKSVQPVPAHSASAFVAAPSPGQAPQQTAPQQQTPAKPADPAAPQQPGQPVPPQSGVIVTPPDQASDSPFKFVTRANLVNLVFTVTDKDGHFKKDLRRENFGLLDNGRPPEAVIAFTQQTNLPLRIGIMLDTSSSIRSRFKFEQDSALDFFLELLKPEIGDRAFVEGFDIQTALTQDYTANVDLLNQGIRKLRPGGGTALFDALYHTCQQQMLTLRETTDVRKVIILVSDGDDNYSHALESDAVKMCQRAETAVYAISTDTSPTRGNGADALKTIAEATGGQVFFPVKLDDMAVFFKNIEEELRSQYSLQYRPANFKLDGGFRTIYLQAEGGRTKYHVRARTGYFAPKAGQ